MLMFTKTFVLKTFGCSQGFTTFCLFLADSIKRFKHRNRFVFKTTHIKKNIVFYIKLFTTKLICVKNLAVIYKRNRFVFHIAAFYLTLLRATSSPQQIFGIDFII